MRLLSGIVALSVVACAAPVDEDAAVERSQDAVVGGTKTFERPEVGMFHHRGRCTGTLVRPNVVLTAMHCGTGIEKDKDVTTASPGYSFEIIKSESERYVYKVDRAHSIASQDDFDGSQKWRAKDILLLRLTEDVPTNIAKPSGIAKTWPRIGGRVAIYGYGCTSRQPDASGRRPGGGTKRKKEYFWTFGLAFGFSETHDECPGDSGGPLLDLERNVVVGTNSGYIGANGDDQFGDVPANSAAIIELADRWAAHR